MDLSSRAARILKAALAATSTENANNKSAIDPGPISKCPETSDASPIACSVLEIGILKNNTADAQQSLSIHEGVEIVERDVNLLHFPESEHDIIDIANAEVVFVDSEGQTCCDIIQEDNSYNEKELDMDKEEMVDNLNYDPMIIQEDNNHNHELVDGPDFEPTKGNFLESNSELDPVDKRGKKRTRENISVLRKLKKQKGTAYVSKTNKAMAQKMLQPNPCKYKCQNGCGLKFNEERRQSVFTKYWELDNPGKRSFLLSCMTETPKIRSYVTGKSRRSRTFQYYLPFQDEKVRVCQQFILKTLDLSHRILSYTFDHRNDLLTARPDQRGKKTPPNKTPRMAEKQVKKFIESLPAVPSHYCRSDSNKLYLPQEFKNKSHVYRIYKTAFCSQEGIAPVSEKVFRRIFRNQYNIGIHVPKKDNCVICEGSKECVNESESYAAHIHNKKLSVSLFKAHQVRSKRDPEFLCVSFDLQKVLNTPHGDNMLLYYTRKYSMYNFTLYESGTRNGYCYLWGESDGKPGANEICSNVFAYLSELEIRMPEVKVVSLFCDSCPGQNKNRQMLVMLYHFVQRSKSVQEISITYLLPGHTYMPADSMHSVIESNYRKKIIWAPSEWPTIITNSRINPRPYEVNVRTYKDFKDWKGIQELSLTSACQMRSVRRAIVQKNETPIAHFNTYDDSGSPQKIRVKDTKRMSSSTTTFSVKTVYTSRLAVSEAKMKDLDALCKKKVIPSRYHSEFLNLPSNNAVEDRLEDEECLED